MRLSFQKNHFVLQTHDTPATMLLSEWQMGAGFYTTRNLKEAVRFRSAADSTAEKIFKKFMLRNRPIPSGGPLSPKELPLLDFQAKRGVPHILGLNRSYLAHQPGLGKTAQAISAVSTKPGRALIICPSFLKVTWAREITKWFIRDFPSISVLKASSNFERLNYMLGADFVIVSDAMLEKEWVRDLIAREKFRFVFIDEGHRFKTPFANRTIAIFGGKNSKIKSRGLIYDAEHVSILSGTPMLNRPIELWPMLFAMAPETIDFMSYQEFGFRYCGATQNDRGVWEFLYSSNEKELKTRIQKRFMQRIRKEDVLPDLPEKVREVIIVDEDTRAKDVVALDRACLKKLGKFSKPESMGDYAIVRHENGKAKTAWAAKFVASYLSEDATEQVILYAHHRDVVARLALLLQDFKPMVINGGVVSSERTKIEDAFQSGRRRLIIGNIDAMNLGLTLTRATRVVFCEYAWTPALNEQAEDRANRIGSQWSVFCQYLVFANSIDEQILTSNIIKEERTERIIA